MSVHLELDGQWSECLEDAEACPSILRREDMTLAEARSIPYHVWESLLSQLQPPDKVDEQTGVSAWLDETGNLHRDYDLPAVIDDLGYRAWYQRGKLHRSGGRAARISYDGKGEWWVDGVLVRWDTD